MCNEKPFEYEGFFVLGFFGRNSLEWKSSKGGWGWTWVYKE